jgi:hypothetical protein
VGPDEEDARPVSIPTGHLRAHPAGVSAPPARPDSPAGRASARASAGVVSPRTPGPPPVQDTSPLHERPAPGLRTRSAGDRGANADEREADREFGRETRLTLLEPSHQLGHHVNRTQAGRLEPHRLRCDESSHKIALRGVPWRPSYLVEIPDFAPSPRDEFAFFSVGLSESSPNLSTDSVRRVKLDKCSTRAPHGAVPREANGAPAAALRPRDSEGRRDRSRPRRRCRGLPAARGDR